MCIRSGPYNAGMAELSVEEQVEVRDLLARLNDSVVSLRRDVARAERERDEWRDRCAILIDRLAS